MAWDFEKAAASDVSVEQSVRDAAEALVVAISAAEADGYRVSAVTGLANIEISETGQVSN